MGKYTTGIREDGYSLQFYANDSMYRTYNVGDAVEPYCNPDKVGSEELFDGVYHGYGTTLNGEAQNGFAIIRDKKLIAILTHKDLNLGQYCLIPDITKQLESRFNIKRLTEEEYRKLFTEKAWQEKEQKEKEAKEEIDKYLEDCTTPQQKLAKMIAYPISVSMDYSKISKTLRE
jgi:hypothetical protein